MWIEKFLQKYPHLEPIYKLLKPHLPQHVEVHHMSDLPKFGFVPRDTVIACALPPNKLFFREIPPTPYDFAHELIHLCNKPNDVPEEVYAYNLAPVVLFCVQETINADIFKLYDLTIDDINAILQKHGFKDLEQFYEFIGVIPHTHALQPSETGLKLTRDPRYSEKDVVITFIAEISAGVKYSELCREVLRDLLRR